MSSELNEEFKSMILDISNKYNSQQFSTAAAGIHKSNSSDSLELFDYTVDEMYLSIEDFEEKDHVLTPPNNLYIPGAEPPPLTAPVVIISDPIPEITSISSSDDDVAFYKEMIDDVKLAFQADDHYHLIDPHPADVVVNIPQARQIVVCRGCDKIIAWTSDVLKIILLLYIAYRCSGF